MEYNWINTNNRVMVVDPKYGQKHKFTVWKVNICGSIHEFVAGEFSNTIWGFYLRSDAIGGL